MTHQRVVVNNIGGMKPVLGHLQDENPSVLRGRNFRWKLAGPYSGWGNRVVAEALVASYPYYHTVTINERAFTLTVDGVMGYDCEAGRWVNYCPTTPTVPECLGQYDWPWSQAYVGDTYYFSHPMVGIVSYNVFTCQWVKLDMTCEVEANGEFILLPETSGSIIDSPIWGITQANNRLIILADDTVSWSAVDNGKDLACDIDCGAGFQSLSHGMYGCPLGVEEVVVVIVRE